MKKYELKKILKDYILNKKLAFREKDPVKKLEYTNKANQDRHLLGLALPTIGIQNNYLEVLENDFAFLQDFGEFAPFIRMFNEQEEIEYEKRAKVYPKRSLRELMFFVRKFYFEVNKKYYSNIYNIMIDKDSIIRLYDAKGFNYSGKIIPMDNKSFFVNIGVDGTLQDYLSFIHEFSHVNAACINESNLTYDKTCLSETDAIFMEMLGIDYLSVWYDSKDSNNYSVEIFNDYVYSARIVCGKMDLLLLSKQELKNKNKVLSKLREDGYNEEEINDILYTDINNYYGYIISYLIAIEIYSKYQDNKEEAFRMLDNVIELSCISPKKYLEAIDKLGINIGENVDNYKQLIIARCVHGKKLQS